jgi:hypothetical protein
MRLVKHPQLLSIGVIKHECQPVSVKEILLKKINFFPLLLVIFSSKHFIFNWLAFMLNNSESEVRTAHATLQKGCMANVVATGH